MGDPDPRQQGICLRSRDQQIIWSSAEATSATLVRVRIDPSSGKGLCIWLRLALVSSAPLRHALVKKIEFTDAKGESDIAMNMPWTPLMASSTHPP